MDEEERGPLEKDEADEGLSLLLWIMYCENAALSSSGMKGVAGAGTTPRVLGFASTVKWKWNGCCTSVANIVVVVVEEESRNPNLDPGNPRRRAHSAILAPLSHAAHERG